MNDVMVEADNLVKIYKTKEIEVVALQGFDLVVHEQEFMAIIGNSGSGKSTFLNMLGGLDRPSAGKLFVDGKNLFTMTDQELVQYKCSTVGFVWQNNARNLLPYLSSVENVMVPMHFTGTKKKKEKAMELLDLVGLSHKKKNRLYELSGGEQQRIAIAIALANSPKVLLADEPTGSVDSKTSSYIFDLFRKLNEEYKQTIIVVTHDVALSKKVQRVAAIRDGKISSEKILKEDYAQRLKENGVQDFEADNSAETQEEYAVVDRSGRIQLPHEMLDAIGVEKNRVKLEVKDGRIMIERP